MTKWGWVVFGISIALSIIGIIAFIAFGASGAFDGTGTYDSDPTF
ncbi:hypothetical protein N802_06430 [Knoellia sinensis KCTC 19936]|uniref:Uncharacterized protein n=1 Tax=Knoellia sinensis KCTC 19936 TaxID=1385520 RepID=A0A0A0J4Y6_9MICO|nr:hypothetical protein [Knoellia sinensis]KGN30671.1 hypothetical protein N802_06430 [Knoellia sinensis KCTC 19936]